MHVPRSKLLKCVLINLWVAMLSTWVVGQTTPEPRYDHHVHLLSERLIVHWKSLGMPFSRPHEHYLDPQVVLTNVKVQRAAAVSMAHLYSSRWFEALENIQQSEGEWVRAENDFIAQCVASNRTRWVGFYSVNPRRHFAFEEMARCASLPGMVGLKLHLPACGIDLGNLKHVQSLKQYFAWCAEHHAAILIHLFSGEEPVQHVDRFWELVAPHPELHLLIAHVGSSGGYNDLSDALCKGLANLLERDEKFQSAPIYFDLSGAVLLEPVEDLQPTSKENCRRLAASMRTLGVNRFVYASDYPVFSAEHVHRALTEHLKLTHEEIAVIYDNASPIFQRP